MKNSSYFKTEHNKVCGFIGVIGLLERDAAFKFFSCIFVALSRTGHVFSGSTVFKRRDKN